MRFSGRLRSRFAWVIIIAFAFGGVGSVIILSDPVVPSEAPTNSAVISKAGNSRVLVEEDCKAWPL